MTPIEVKRLEEALYNSQQANAQKELRIKELERELEELREKLPILSVEVNRD